ncbi:MAG: M1 family aminopeptidase [Flavobacteriales bacterium]
MLRGGSAITDPGNLRSDTLDILNYHINLDMTVMDQQLISGTCAIDFKSKMDDIDWINLDLLSLTVDSVKADNEHLTFSHVGSLLHITLPIALNANDEFTVNVHYHGSPVTDGMWGGFYFSAGYAYNLGVGFEANPHNFGRVWFPCFDNFVERSTFSVDVLTNNNRTAYCGGIRTGLEVVGQDSLLTHWQLNEQIPSYLASVAVASYTHAESSYINALGNDIPVYLTAKAVDTTEMKQSMTNLHTWLQGAEENYGPYRWSRVGFTAVPFNGGAMEHATNIAYPLFAIDGSLAYEELYAHELSHHWWGDLVTCRNAYDMWINEGWASYSEALFNEVIYGHDSYINYVKSNHKDVLLHAHQDDGQRLPVSPVPHELTYGAHVYNKGADVVHTLRKMMGSDENFRNAIQGFMEEYQFADVSTEDLQNFFQNYTTNDLTSFFEHAVHQPGFAEFRVKNFEVEDDAIAVTIEQYAHYAPSLYDHVLMNITAMNADGDLLTWTNIELTDDANQTSYLDLTQSFTPVAFFLNEDDGINMAVLGEHRWIYETGADDFDYAEMDFEVDNLGGADSIFVRVENHFAAAGTAQPQPEYYISPDRWWNVITNAPDDAVMNAEIRYFGNETQTNYYDSLFFHYVETSGLNEDSLLLLFRPDANALWGVWPTYDLSTIGSNDNWTGRFVIDNVKQGEYAWAVATGTEGASEMALAEAISIRQLADEIVITAPDKFLDVTVTDAAGRVIVSLNVNGRTTMDTSQWSSGTYVLACSAGSSPSQMQYRVIKKIVKL